MRKLISAFLIFSLTSFSQANDGIPRSGSRTVQIYTSYGSFGQGVLLDQRHILTAAHVVDESSHNPKYRINTLELKGLSASLVKIGHRNRVDLALLILDQDYPHKIEPLNICSRQPRPGDELGVYFDDKGLQTHASHDARGMYKGEWYSEATEAYFSHGVSGAPVYLSDTACLVGIISHYKFHSSDIKGSCLRDDLNGLRPFGSGCSVGIGTRFVGPVDIRQFLESKR